MNGKPVIGKIEFEPRPDHYGLLSRIRRSENKIPKVFICIRLRPKSQNPRMAKKEFKRNINRAKVVARYAVLNNYDPEATTIYFTQFLNDSLIEERNLGMKIGQERLRLCDKLWCVTDNGETPSSGMRADMEFAKANGIPIAIKNFAEISAWIKNHDSTSH